MYADIRRRNQVNDATYVQSARHEMEEPDVGYLEELEQLIADGVVRARYGGRAPTWLRSARVRLATQRLRDRHPRRDPRPIPRRT